MLIQISKNSSYFLLFLKLFGYIFSYVYLKQEAPNFFMMSQFTYKLASALLGIFFLSFPIEADANNWTNSNSKFDFEKLEQLPVPKNFPEYSFRAYEKCKTSKGSEFSNDLEIFVSNDFLWAAKHSYQGDWVRTYIGKLTKSGKFVINVSEASKKWKSEPKWMQYVLPNTQSVVDSLDSGKIKGKTTQGSYWRKCNLSINNVGESNKISLAKFKPINRQSIALNSLITRQEIALEKLAKMGLSKGEAYDFAYLLNELETSAEAEAARKKAEEEERKRAEAEAARKKAEEEERKRAEAEELKLKIQVAKEEAQNLYSIFVEFVKTNSATNVLRLNELYVRAPEINLTWDKENLDDFNKFKSQVLEIEDFKEFYEERIEEFNEQLADAQLAAIELLEKLSSELKEIIAENFGTEIAKETARLAVKIEEVINDFKETSEFDAVLVGHLIEDAKVLFVAAGRDLKSLEGFSLKGLTSNVSDFISNVIPNPLNLFK